MPKDASRKSRASYHPYAGHARESCSSKDGGAAEDAAAAAAAAAALIAPSPKEWEDATCPICMEFPHNAVLLVCASHDNGCRPYVCDTSYRHSNCFDQYRKLSKRAHSSSAAAAAAAAAVDTMIIHGPPSGAASSVLSQERSSVRMRPLRELLDNEGAPGRAVRELGLEDGGNSNAGAGAGPELQQQQHQHHHQQQQLESSFLASARSSISVSGEDGMDLLCPLCRGKVNGWKVVEHARRHLNCKTRNCAHEACAFEGSYDELRKHARCSHPYARPSDVDPARQRDWRHLERERDIGDVLSTIQSAMPGARILGDYVIDEDNEVDGEEEGEDNEISGDEGNWWTVFLLFQVFGPVAHGSAGGAGGGIPASRLRGLSRGSSHHLSRFALPSSRQALWGEDIQVNQVDDAAAAAAAAAAASSHYNSGVSSSSNHNSNNSVNSGNDSNDNNMNNSSSSSSVPNNNGANGSGSSSSHNTNNNDIVVPPPHPRRSLPSRRRRSRHRQH